LWTKQTGYTDITINIKKSVLTKAW
jgi:hypothetical protein